MVGHSLAAVINNASFTGEMISYAIGKVVTPSVFIFIFLFGYGQGIKRKRLNRNIVIKRTINIFTPYIFFATVALILYIILGSPYDKMWMLRDTFNGKLNIASYFVTLISFTASWQYYFLVLIFAFQAFGNIFRNIPVVTLEKITKIALYLHILEMLLITVFLWLANPMKFNLYIVGGFISPNPIFWFFPFMWGYTIGSKKGRLPWEEIQKKDYFFGIFFFLISVFEVTFLGNKWNTFYLIDQFTLFSFFLNIYALKFIGRIAGKINLRKHRRIGKFFMTFGVYSFIVYMVHMPYEWFLFVGLQNITGFQFPYAIQVLLLIGFGFGFSTLVIAIAKSVPKKIRRLIMGF